MYFYRGKGGTFAEFSDDDTASTASLSDSSLDSSLDDEKRVSFADTLVSHVWERPRTPPEDVSKLFFSSEETSRCVSFSCRFSFRSRVLRRFLRDSYCDFSSFRQFRNFCFRHAVSTSTTDFKLEMACFRAYMLGALRFIS